MSIILFLFLFLLAILLFGFSIIIAIVRTIFGLGRSSSRKRQTEYGQDKAYRYSNTNPYSGHNFEEDDFSEDNQGNRQKKIFSKDEGEYVDFEEIDSSDDSSEQG